MKEKKNIDKRLNIVYTISVVIIGLIINEKLNQTMKRIQT